MRTRGTFYPAPIANGPNSIRNQVAGANAFVPTSLTGCQLWLRTDPITGYLFTAAAGTGQAANGNEVLHWADRSGNARNVTDASQGPDLLNDLAPTSPNGKPTLTFVAATVEKLAAASATWAKFLHDGTGCTGFVVYKQTDENVGVLLDSGGYAGGANTGLMLYADDSSTKEGHLVLAVGKGSNIVNMDNHATAGSNAYPAAAWHIARFSFKTGDLPYAAQLFGDGCYCTGAEPSAAPATGDPTGGLRIGLDIDGVSGNALAFDGSVAEVLLFNRVLTTLECRQVENYLSLSWLVPVGNVGVMGDSILAGTDVTRIPATVIANRLGALWRCTNFATSGARVSTGSPQVQTGQWAAASGAKRRGYNFHVVCCGVNDLRNSQSGATTYGQLVTLFDEILTDPNNRLVCCTVMPWKGGSTWSAPNEAQRLILNTSIRGFAAANANTYLVDLAAVMADPADAESLWAPYSLDNLHPTQAGSDAMSLAIADKLLAVGLL